MGQQGGGGARGSGDAFGVRHGQQCGDGGHNHPEGARPADAGQQRVQAVARQRRAFQLRHTDARRLRGCWAARQALGGLWAGWYLRCRWLCGPAHRLRAPGWWPRPRGGKGCLAQVQVGRGGIEQVVGRRAVLVSADEENDDCSCA